MVLLYPLRNSALVPFNSTVNEFESQQILKRNEQYEKAHDEARKAVNQNTLNLIAFYHNNRRYRAGKRVDKTPMEILTGKKRKKDWTEPLFDLIEEKDPHFFSAAA
jgi:hypothetical protein